jgi:dimethyl sulfoxide reductase membrane subunit
MKIPKIPVPAVILGILAALGLGAACRQSVVGLDSTGLHEPVVWGLYIVCFLFFAGIGAGALTVASVAACSAREEHRPAACYAAIVALVSLILAGLFITIDLGRPDRAFLMVLKANFRSPLVWDFAILNAMMGLAAFYVLALLRLAIVSREGGNGSRITKLLTVRSDLLPRERLARVLRVVGGAGVFAVPALYLLTVRVFSSLRARPDWFSTGLAPVFLVSALLSGLAAVALVAALSGRLPDGAEGEGMQRTVARLLILLIAVDIALLLGPLVTMRQFDAGPHGAPGLDAAAGLELVFGLILPLALLAGVRGGRLALPSVLILLGVFVKRWHIVIPAMLHRNLPLPDASYSPTLHEYTVTAGFVAVGILLCYGFLLFTAKLDEPPTATGA